MKTTIAAIALISGFFLHSASAAKPKDPVVTLTTPVDTPFDGVVKILDALKAVGVEKLQARNTSTAEAKGPSIVLTVDRQASTDSVIKIIDACKAAGVNTIGLKFTPAEETAK